MGRGPIMMTKISNRKPYTLHESDTLLNKENLNEIIELKGLKYNDLHEKIVKDYGLDLSYKGFMSLLDNRSTWKLVYAWAIVSTLNIKYEDIFDLVTIDVGKMAGEKEEWKRKYQR